MVFLYQFVAENFINYYYYSKPHIKKNRNSESNNYDNNFIINNNIFNNNIYNINNFENNTQKSKIDVNYKENESSHIKQNKK